MRRVLFAVSLVVAAAACQPEPPPAPVPGTLDKGDEVLVTVDGHKVTQRLIDIGTAPMPEQQREQLLENPAQRKQLLERLAFAELLYNEAVDKKIYEDPEVKDSLALAQREVLANLMLERIADEAVTDEAVQEKYDSMAVQFNRPSAKVQHILVERQDEANQIVEQIKGGQIDFLDAAKKYSKDRGLEKHGGDLGWTIRAPIRELQDSWENAPLNEIVGPVEGRLGFHILKVTERRDKTPLEEVEGQLRDMLKVEKMRSARSDMMSEADVVWEDGSTGPGDAAKENAKPPEGVTLELKEEAP